MTTAAETSSPLGILAGSGSIPLYIAERCRNKGRAVYICGIEGTADPKIEQYPHSWIKWVQLDKVFKQFRKAGVEELVIIGGAKRPKLSNIAIDFGLIRNLPFLLSLTMGGDDEILSSIVGFVESKGFRIKGAHQVAPELTAGSGCMTRKQPNKTDLQDIEKGIETVLKLGTMDIGQGAVVARGYVLCVEAAEGTDQMLKRAEALRQWGSKWLGKRFGVLVKLPKPHQELRIDMPAIGPRTVELAAKAGLNGIAVEAGKVLISEREATLAEADRRGLFILGLEAKDFPAI